MKIKLPTFENLEIIQTTPAATKRAIDRHPQLVLLVPKPERARVPETVPYADDINKRLARGGWRETPPVAVIELPNARATRVVVAFVEPGADTFARLTATRKAIAASRREPAAALAAVFHGLGDATGAWAEAMVAAAGAVAFDLAVFKKAPGATRLAKLTLVGTNAKIALERTRATVRGNNLARWLSALPGNALPPSVYRRLIGTLAKRHGWTVETLDRRALARKGCGAFLAVVQGSEERDAAIVRLRYTPKDRGKAKPVALVGKGICFDTGGVNLKPARYMNGMHEDMLGSAVALGSLLALTELEVPYPVDCWLALAQNHIGPRAYKPNDVVTACDGTTIEIVHTDAEGRMVLADTLALAARARPALAIDYATLTGSCVAALGTRYSGVFTNRDAFNPVLIEAGRASGERVWPFPQDADYDEALESKVADVKQCTLDNDADHILGARFLSRFIGADTPWVHVDLSAGSAKGGLGAVPTESTGFGVRFTLEVLSNGKLLD